LTHNQNIRSLKKHALEILVNQNLNLYLWVMILNCGFSGKRFAVSSCGGVRGRGDARVARPTGPVPEDTRPDLTGRRGTLRTLAVEDHECLC